MTDRSNDVIWGILKRFDSAKTKWNGKNWTHCPFSNNGMYNAGQMSNGVGISVKKTKTAKNFKRTFTMTIKTSQKNNISKRKPNSMANPAVSTQDLGRDVHHAAKIIQKQRFITDNERKQALRKLFKLAKSTGGVAAKAEAKK